MALVEDGRLICLAEGTTTITASVNGYLAQRFTLRVSAEAAGVSVLPAALEEIGSEAFLGDTGITALRIPDGVAIGEDLFGEDSAAVVLCTPGSAAHQAALAQGWPYILIPQE